MKFILPTNRCNSIQQSLSYYIVIVHAFRAIVCVLSDSASDHLEFAQKLMIAGQYNDALQHFHEAINNDPNNYLTYFKRATVLLALNRPKAALEDLNRALELKRDFSPALSQRGSLHVKFGNLDNAQLDYEHIINLEPHNQDALMMFDRINRIREDINNVQDLIEENQYDVALNTLVQIIEVVPYNAELLKVRAEAFERVGETRRAITDYRTLAKLSVDAATYLTIARLCFRLGEVEESLNNVRECLKLDPDHKSCMEFYKPVKKLNNHIKNMVNSKNSNDNEDCNTQGQNALKMLSKHYQNQPLLPLIYSIKSVMCHCLSKSADIAEGIKICDEALERSDEGGIEGIAIDKAEVICDKADLLAEKEEYAEAMKLFQQSNKIRQSNRAREGAEKMKRLQHQKNKPKKRDYYKILGVNRHADENEINKAYRKLAAKWHPDRHKDEAAKKAAQAKFMDIADAKSVLTDAKKRRQFDSGEDPLDPETKQGGHPGHGFYADPFRHFGSTFYVHI